MGVHFDGVKRAAKEHAPYSPQDQRDLEKLRELIEQMDLAVTPEALADVKQRIGAYHSRYGSDRKPVDRSYIIEDPQHPGVLKVRQALVESLFEEFKATEPQSLKESKVSSTPPGESSKTAQAAHDVLQPHGQDTAG